MGVRGIGPGRVCCLEFFELLLENGFGGHLREFLITDAFLF